MNDDTPLTKELRCTIHALQRELQDVKRHNVELRDAIDALMEPGMSRVVYSKSGTIIMRPEWQTKPVDK